jgi:magnesium transporter
MLAIFRRGQRELESVDPSATAAPAVLPVDAVWIDMMEPTPEEVQSVQRMVGIEMPTREEMREIEASSRVYEEGDALFMTATVLINVDDPPPGTAEVTFILKGDRLVTLRYADPQPFRSALSRIERQGAGLASANGVFFWLVDRIVARLADVLERAALDVDALSAKIFGAARVKKKDERVDLLEAMEMIGRNGSTASKVRESLHTLQRILLAVSTSELLPQGAKKEARQRAKILNRDVSSLTDQVAFLSTKINLLLDATLGIINIEQNNIIKIFSVLAIVFLPPTLIASIYGMNFEHMPELRWMFGYPFSLLLMILAAGLPFLYFRRRGWL